MIRPATPADTSSIIDLSIATGLFPPEGVDTLREILEGFHTGQTGVEHRLDVYVEEGSDTPIGVIYYGPDAMTDRKWDLWMIAVSPDHQGQGIGRDLIMFTEEQILANQGRVLLIDTSSLPKYDGTRVFYAKLGYTEVARIPDYYADGESKVTFWKRIG